jgi:hypothetical protein
MRQFKSAIAVREPRNKGGFALIHSHATDGHLELITSHEQLDALVAERVAGFSDIRHEEGENVDIDTREIYPWAGWRGTVNGERRFVPRFSRSADAVLPLLERTKAYEVRWCYDYPKAAQCEVTVFRSLVAIKRYQDKVCVGAPDFPLAACLALLAAKGIQVKLEIRP